MTSMDRLPESSPERINIAKLAQELGVDEKYFQYGDGPKRAEELIFECVGHLSLEDKNGKQACFVKAEEARRWYDLFDTFQGIEVLPLMISQVSIEKWRMDIFVIHLSRYFTLKGLKYKLAKMENLFMQNMLFSMPAVAVNGLNEAEIKSAFWVKFFEKIAPLVLEDDAFLNLSMQLAQYDTKYHELTAKLKQGSVDAIDFANTQFWSRSNLPLVKIFIDNSPSQKNPSLDIPYLDRLLCHVDIHLFPDLIKGFTHEESKHIPAWAAWIKERGHLLFQNTETSRVFLKVFGIEWQALVAQKNKGRLVVHRKIPTRLHKVLQDAYLKNPLPKKPAELIAKITPHAPSQTAMAALVHRPVEPTKIIVPALDIKTILPDFEISKGANKQLTQIDFSGCDFPEWTTVQVQRSLPSKKKREFEVIEDIDLRGKNTIKPVLGQGIQWHFAYIIAVSLPSTHRFEGTNFIEVSYYAKAEPTPAEIAAERVQREALKNQPKILPETVTAVVVDVEEKVENIIDPLANSLIAASFVLSEKQELYAVQKEYQGGPINITLSDADCVAVLGDESAVLLSEHKHWTVNEDDSISPLVDDTDIKEALLTIAEKIRENYRLKQEQEKQEILEKQEIAEYESQRKNFEPLLEFARNFKFEWREKGDFEDQKDKLRTELKSFGWVLPWTLGNQVFWRHGAEKVKITYTSKMCQFFQIQTEDGRILKEAEKKCYQEVAEAFAHIARFFNAETRERKKMITREQSMRKEVENSAVSYDALLEKGQARLVLFSPYQQSHGWWSSKFPTERNPYMLDERASHRTLESLLQQYPQAELCYRRDQLCLNGEIGEEAGEESVENTLQNIQDLRHSPRARYILRKRILITLWLEKYSGDKMRAPIVHEKNKKEHSFSALDILNHLSDLWKQTKHVLSPSDTSWVRDRIKQEGYGYKLFSAIQPDKLQEKSLYEMQHISLENVTEILTVDDIDDSFLDTYIDCLELLKIRVHYVWPLSSRLDEHKARMKKHAAKKAAAEAPKTTAD